MTEVDVNDLRLLVYLDAAGIDRSDAMTSLRTIRAITGPASAVQVLDAVRDITWERAVEVYGSDACRAAYVLGRVTERRMWGGESLTQPAIYPSAE